MLGGKLYFFYFYTKLAFIPTFSFAQVLLLSFALLVAPNYSPFGKRKLTNDGQQQQQDQEATVDSIVDSVANGRALLPGETILKVVRLDDYVW